MNELHLGVSVWNRHKHGCTYKTECVLSVLDLCVNQQHSYLMKYKLILAPLRLKNISEDLNIWLIGI